MKRTILLLVSGALAVLLASGVALAVAKQCPVRGADKCVGTQENDRLLGTWRDDWMVGRGGNDTLKGSGAGDYLYAPSRDSPSDRGGVNLDKIVSES